MLRDRAAPVDLFALVPALELRFEPQLAELDRLLEDDQIFQQIKADLRRRRPHTTETGRQTVLKRRFGLDRCRYHGEAGMERWVGWGLLAHNLRQISRSVVAESAE